MTDRSLYVIKNTMNGKHYVGQTTKYPLDRISRHVYNANCGRGYLLTNAINKHGLDKLVVIYTSHCSSDTANAMEEELIKRFNSLSPFGYNILSKGNLSHDSMPELVRQKISKANKGKKRSLEAKLKQSQAQLGRKISGVARQNMSTCQRRDVPLEIKQRLLDIKQALSNGDRVTDIAKRFGVHQTHVSKIKHGKTGFSIKE